MNLHSALDSNTSMVRILRWPHLRSTLATSSIRTKIRTEAGKNKGKLETLIVTVCRGSFKNQHKNEMKCSLGMPVTGTLPEICSREGRRNRVWRDGRMRQNRGAMKLSNHVSPYLSVLSVFNINLPPLNTHTKPLPILSLSLSHLFIHPTNSSVNNGVYTR